MVSEVWPELSKEPLFCGFCQKALFEERYIYSAITIIISKQTAIYKEPSAIFQYFISYMYIFYYTETCIHFKLLSPLSITQY